MDARGRTRVVGGGIAGARRDEAPGARFEPDLPARAGVAQGGFFARRLRMGRHGKRGHQRDRIPAQGSGSWRPIARGVQFHAGAAAQLPGGCTVPRDLARNSQYRRPGIRRFRMGQPRRRGIGARERARPPRVGQSQSAAAGHDRLALGVMTKVQRRGAAEQKPAKSAKSAIIGMSATQGINATQGIKEGRVRAVIDAVLPAVDGGRFPIKRIAGEAVGIEAHCFTDGHDRLRVVLRWRAAGANDEYEVDMRPQPNDVWLAEFTPPRAGRYRYTVAAWVDHFESWRHELERREIEADIRVAMLVGAALIDEAAGRAAGSDAAILVEWSAQLRAAAADAGVDAAAQKAMALDAARAGVVARYADRSLAATMSLELVADRKRAGFSSWYELFPRSAGTEPGHHGTFRDVEARLPYLADMGFDVLYFPPIHPIGRINRKGTNNALAAQPEDVGSPWAIGAAEGGHKDILPQLGTLDEFRHLLAKARELGIEIALDIAFQCAPDHPYVKAHPQWFKHRPDGSVQYAENPPKKY